MDGSTHRDPDRDRVHGDGRRAVVRTGSAKETRALGSALALVARPGDRLALVGPLGAGKTQLAKGFAIGLGVTDVVNSPSFTLMAEYEGRLRLFHQDLYRLAGTDEALAGGLLDERQDDGVTLSEWADRLDATLDPDRLTVRIEPEGEERPVHRALRHRRDRDALRRGGGGVPRRRGAARVSGRSEAAERPNGWSLAIDTATHLSVVALGSAGRPSARDVADVGRRHGPALLEQIDRVLAAAGLRPSELSLVVAGTGPGSFTGLRVGLATAKTLAYVTGVAVIGVASTDALRRAAVDARAAGPDAVVVLPAGAHDHYLAAPGETPTLIAPGALSEALSGA